MIKIVRGDEPEALTLSRDEHLARTRLRTRPPSAEEFVGYAVGQGELARRQSYKYAYCELPLRDEAAPVEHFRPKGQADDVDWNGLAPRPARSRAGTVDTDAARFERGLPPTTADDLDRVRWVRRAGYWWLAWTWENQVFGCTGCNTGVKGTRFPQASGAAALQEHDAPPGSEAPLLLDPTDPDDDPVNHIQYREVSGRWVPTARAGSTRGAWTIALLRLSSSPSLVTAYTTRVKHLNGRQTFRAVGAIRDLDPPPPSLQVAWKELLDDVLDPTEELLGLTWDWLDAMFPAPWRAARTLDLPRPVRCLPEVVAGVPRPPIATIPALDGLPAALADQVRVARNFTARQKHASEEQRTLGELIPDLALHRPEWTDDQLASLLRCTLATVRAHRTP